MTANTHHRNSIAPPETDEYQRGLIDGCKATTMQILALLYNIDPLAAEQLAEKLNVAEEDIP